MKNILILEDNITVQTSLIKIIEKKFNNYYTMYTAKDINSALNIALEINTDVFIVDIELGEKDNGIQFAEKIRKIEKYNNTPLIFETADSSNLTQILNNIHCFGYLIKPYNSKLLLELLTQLSQNDCTVTNIIEENNNWPIINLDNRNIHLDSSKYEVFLSSTLSTYIKLSEIIYIESFQRNVVIHTVAEDITTKYLSLSKFITQNGDKYFFRCNASFVINTCFFDSFNSKDNTILLIADKNEYEIRVSRRFIKETKRRFEL